MPKLTSQAAREAVGLLGPDGDALAIVPHPFCCAALPRAALTLWLPPGPLRWNFRPQCDQVSAAVLLNTAEPRLILRSWKSTRQKLNALRPIPSMPGDLCCFRALPTHGLHLNGPQRRSDLGNYRTCCWCSAPSTLIYCNTPFSQLSGSAARVASVLNMLCVN